MSQPPEYPGRQRLKRAAASAGSDAYQGAFEAVGSVLMGCGLGYWADRSWGTTPYGVLVGAVVGFAAMVLRLMRLGKELHPEQSEAEAETQAGPGVSDDLGIGEAPGISDVLRADSLPAELPAEPPAEPKEGSGSREGNKDDSGAASASPRNDERE